ncbi:sulfatase domain protein [Cordyceps fumosorosea ARSEF 2679]|uniref:Sulfatase domain protein n=1 Tax=Cordyceps fumosorosea (strain ARSEF 2679) TaxID=1081104 RepID=A0A167R099_CORFA|nr:sulfatase domain protein [Cordyceps fumosorosea ARSEF 2679]OAA58154.1 sulfatase domain protein [Cordyceps fumosorosea ARSEF 2679]
MSGTSRRTTGDRHSPMPTRALAAALFLSRAPLALLLAPLPKAANRRFAFSFVAVAVVAAKIVHVVARERALLRRDLVGWMLSFFLQDFVLLLALRFLTEWSHNGGGARRSVLLRVLARFVNSTVSLFSAVISVVSITFFLYARAEVRWRDVAFAGDSGSRGVLLSGLVTLLTVLGGITAIAGFFQNGIFMIGGAAIDAVKWPFQSLVRRYRAESGHAFSRVPSEALDDPFISTGEKRDDSLRESAVESRSWRLVWSGFIVLQVLFSLLRPNEGALIFMSWTTPLIPFVDFKESASILRDISPYNNVGINYEWDDLTALDKPIRFDWLPQDTVLKGFEDWYEEGRPHYNAKADPLKISNMDQELLPGLKESLSNMTIKHIVLVVLESTRKDVFPLKRDDLIWRRFEEAAPHNQLPGESVARLETLTPTANYLTGDYDDGFEHENTTRRGGLNFKDANTASTYTRKSMVGTMCGVWPLVADFNKEHAHHIYQPCLPQILEAFSRLDQDDPAENPWRSQYLQSVTLSYDHADESTEQFGFPRDNIVGARYLRSNAAKFGRVDLPDINYFGMEEAPLLDYVRDAFATARESGERVFMTHLTSTTHHPYAIPAEEAYVPLATGRWDDLSHYVNAVGYDDRWLGRILGVLDDEGVAGETLVVVTGDHGISLPENNTPASYHNPNAGCNHVPVVMSHPGLPPIDVDDAVSTMEILPTVLDLLRETGSLSRAASKAAGDLLANYEGQSLIRPLRNSAYRADGHDPDEEDLRGWQFVVMNPGRAMLGVRDRRRPTWRLVVPVIHDVEWRFTDLATDPTDTDSVQAFEFPAFLDKVQRQHGKEPARWAEEGAFIARWWVEENNKRYEYGPYAAEPTAT